MIVLLTLALAAVLAQPATAQVEADPILSGRVTVGGGTPAEPPMVVLHRVDAVDAGEIDSVRADAQGRFRFRLPTVPDPGGPGEVYFASTRFREVLYFGPPISEAAALDSVYRIEAYDTAAAPGAGAELPILARYMLAEPHPEGGWQFTDLIQFLVEGDRTLVAPDSAGATWSYPLPPGVSSVQIGGGDLAPALTAATEGRLVTRNPLSPGPRQVVMRYRLPELALDIPLPGGADEMDFLVMEPAPSVAVAGLDAVETVELEPGTRYRRFAGSPPAGSVLTVTSEAGPRPLPLAWLALGVGGVLAAAGLYAVRKGGSGTPAADAAPAATGAYAPTDGPAAGGTPMEERRRLILEVARLDQALEGATDEGQVGRLGERRTQLLRRIRELT